jgi:DNA-directed RNA polymerase subunit RPC12/RpoP
MLPKETQKTDYKCLRCGKEYTALDVAFLVATLPPSSGADFALICENCGAELNAKLNEEEQIKEDDKMQRFNEQTEHIRKTLREVEKISFNP